MIYETKKEIYEHKDGTIKVLWSTQKTFKDMLEAREFIGGEPVIKSNQLRFLIPPGAVVYVQKHDNRLTGGVYSLHCVHEGELLDITGKVGDLLGAKKLERDKKIVISTRFSRPGRLVAEIAAALYGEIKALLYRRI